MELAADIFAFLVFAKIAHDLWGSKKGISPKFDAAFIILFLAAGTTIMLFDKRGSLLLDLLSLGAVVVWSGLACMRESGLLNKFRKPLSMQGANLPA
jgi:hypothetical protein